MTRIWDKELGQYITLESQKPKKTTYRLDWANGFTIEKRLSRSFKTLEEAQKFAEGKERTEIYISRRMYKVEWTKIIDNND